MVKQDPQTNIKWSNFSQVGKMGKTTKWQSSWDNEADENGDLFWDYLIKQDEEYVKCRQVILYFIQRNHVNNQYRPSWPPVQMEESINWANKESKAATTMGLRTETCWNSDIIWDSTRVQLQSSHICINLIYFAVHTSQRYIILLITRSNEYHYIWRVRRLLAPQVL